MRVQVAEDGTYRAFTGKMDMGQGARTLLTQAFAEELGVPVGRGAPGDGRHAAVPRRWRHVGEHHDAADGAGHPEGGCRRARPRGPATPTR